MYINFILHSNSMADCQFKSDLDINLVFWVLLTAHRK